MPKNIELSKYIKLFAVCIFVVLVAIQANKSFVLDEIDFPIVSEATSQTLKPVYYRGEVSPRHVGTYHPTLYINSLAFFIKVFGYSEVSVRFFGVVCTLLSAYLLVLIFRQLVKKKNEIAEALFLGLFLLNPYTLANTTLPDIDSTILPVVILLFIHQSLKYLLVKKDMSYRVMLILASLFALALWSKLTTPLLIPPFLAGVAIITSKNIKNSLLFTIKVTVVGFLAFLLTYFLYCKLLGLSTTYTYGFLLDSFTKGTDTDGPLVGAYRNLYNIRSFIYWPTIPVVVLSGVSFVGIVLDKTKDERTRIKKLLVAFALLITVFYIALISPFGGFFKYPFPVFGAILLGIALFYDRYMKDYRINWIYAFLATLIGFLVEKMFWGDSMFTNAAPFNYVWLLLVLVIVIYLLLRSSFKNIASAAFVLLIFFSVGFQISISRIQAISPYPTKYHYGQEGLDETTEYLRVNTSSDGVIWAMKDVGYYTNNRYYESYGYYFVEALETDLINMLQDSKVRYYVVSTGIGQDNINYYPNIKEILEANAVKQEQFGNFVIYKSKD